MEGSGRRGAFFKEVVNKSAMEDCGMKGVRGQGIKKGSKWWNDGVKMWQMLERWLHNRSEEWEMYKEKNRGKRASTCHNASLSIL